DHRGVLSPFYLPFSAKNRVGAPQLGCQALHPFTDVFIQQASARGSSALRKYPRLFPWGNLQLKHLPSKRPVSFSSCPVMTDGDEVPCSLEVQAPAQLHTRLGPVSRIS
uniref:Uncharacterized protein n=1 Tax=Cebus imitator TaxID=2715852 RepID=A0A2K5QNZ1_CEBIM